MILFNPAGTGATSALTANSTYNDTSYQISSSVQEETEVSRFRAFVSADQAGTLNIQQSVDGTTWYTTTPQAISANSPTVVESLIVLPYVRASYTNGTTNQGSFRLMTALVG